jgi:hypothetical protein
MEDSELDLDALLDETPFVMPPETVMTGSIPHLSDVSDHHAFFIHAFLPF